MKSQVIDVLVILFKIDIQILKIQAKGLTEPYKKGEAEDKRKDAHNTNKKLIHPAARTIKSDEVL